MRKIRLINKKFIKRTVACIMSVAVVATSSYGYITYADQKATTEKINKSDVEETLNNILSVTEKEIGKDETVYLIADNAGSVINTIVSEHLKNPDGSNVIVDKSDLKDIENVNGDETFTQNGENIEWNANGNDIYYQGTTEKKAPISVKITYYLNGRAIPAEDIAGKSGKVKIRFDYMNNERTTANISGKKEEIYVPFVAISGMILGDNFKNIEVTNGKLISDGQNNVVVGMAMPGMKQSLNLERKDSNMDIPEFVEVSAEVEEFSLDMTMTVAMCNTGLDISNINMTDIDSTVNNLENATGKLEDGSIQLSDGLGTLKQKMPEFKSGVLTLKNGISEYTKGTKKIDDGIGSLAKSTGSLIKGMKSIDTAVDAIYKNFGTKKDSDTIRGGAKSLADGAKQVNDGVKKLNSGTGTLAAGSKQVSEGAAALNTGIGQLSTSLELLKTGAGSLATGSEELNNGVSKLISLVEGLRTQLSDKEKQILEQLAASNITTVAQAGTALEGAKKLQASIITAIANDNYTGLDRYGVTDVTSAAAVLSETTKKVNSLQEAVSTLQVLDTIVNSMSGNEEDMKKLNQGAKEVADGAKTVSGGISKVDSTITTIGTKTSELSKGAKQVYGGVSTVGNSVTTLAEGTGKLEMGSSSLDTGIETLYSKAILPLHKGIDMLMNKLPQLKSGVKQLDRGAYKVVKNNNKLNSGASTLNEGTLSIADGVSQLEEGANTLADGIKEFNEKAIKKIVYAYKGDINTLVSRLNAVMNAGENYTTFTGKADNATGNVKFIIKTDAVKEENK